MPTQVRYRRGTTAEHSTFTGAAGEMTIDTTKNTCVVHDGSTIGGHPLATAADLSVSQGDITTLQGEMTTAQGDITALESRPNRNILINGGFDVWQRGTSFPGVTTGSYTADRWKLHYSGSMAFDVARLTTTVGTSDYCYQLIVTSPDTSLASNEYTNIDQIVEGNRLQGLAPGRAHAKDVTLSFYVYSPVTGTYSIGLRNKTFTRSYVAEYTVNAADTWEKKTITLTMDTAGSWDLDNGTGMWVTFCLASGPQYRTSTIGSWQNGNFMSSTNQVNFVSAASRSFLVTNVQMEVGDKATDFEQRAYGEEHALCQRYYEAGEKIAWSGDVTGIGTNYATTVKFSTTKRAVPSVTVTSAGESSVISNSRGSSNHTVQGFAAYANTTSTGAGQYYYTDWTADAEL